MQLQLLHLFTHSPNRDATPNLALHLSPQSTHCRHVCTCMYMYVCTCMYVHVCMYMYVSAGMYVHVCMYMYVSTCMYMYVSVHPTHCRQMHFTARATPRITIRGRVTGM